MSLQQAGHSRHGAFTVTAVEARMVKHRHVFLVIRDHVQRIEGCRFDTPGKTRTVLRICLCLVLSYRPQACSEFNVTVCFLSSGRPHDRLPHRTASHMTSYCTYQGVSPSFCLPHTFTSCRSHFPSLSISSRHPISPRLILHHTTSDNLTSSHLP